MITSNVEWSQRVAARADQLLRSHELSIYRKTDHLFAQLLLAQWVAGIIAAVTVSPRVWAGFESDTHVHLYGAVLLGGLISIPPMMLARSQPGSRWTRHSIAAAQAATSALLIHLTGGRIETHFHVFGSLAFLAFYRDWTVLVTASGVVAVDHFVRGWLWPQSIFGVLTSENWRWLEHAGWVVFEDAFLIYSCLQSRREMSQIAAHQAALEMTKARIEDEVWERTSELVSANEELARSADERAAATEERDRMQEQLQQAQKLEAVGQLAAGIAHEINTPTQYVSDNTRFLQESFAELDALLEAYARVAREAHGGAVSSESIGTVERLAEEVEPDYLRSEIPRAIEQSLEGIDRVSSIVRAMKDFSHPGVEDMTSIDLNRGIRSTATVCRNEWKYCAELELDLDPDLPDVECQPSEINQVVLNIIVNAAHAIAEQQDGESGSLGTIRVATEARDDHVLISISDTGPGMSEEVRRRVFDPFFTTKEVGKGTGQGLAMAHSVITQQHGGKIEVESTPGAGATFTIHLPISQADAVASERVGGEGS